MNYPRTCEDCGKSYTSFSQHKRTKFHMMVADKKLFRRLGLVEVYSQGFCLDIVQEAGLPLRQTYTKYGKARKYDRVWYGRRWVDIAIDVLRGMLPRNSQPEERRALVRPMLQFFLRNPDMIAAIDSAWEILTAEPDARTTLVRQIVLETGVMELLKPGATEKQVST